MEGTTRDEWIASMRDSLVKICQTQGVVPDWEKEHDLAFIGKYYALLGKYDPVSSSLKTCQLSFIQDSTECFPTLPRWGWMRDGAVFALQKSPLRTQETDGSFSLPTIMKFDSIYPSFTRKSIISGTFGTRVNSLPYLIAAIHGKMMSADIACWVMGFPATWAQLRDTVTHKTYREHRAKVDSEKIAK
jgi:hypothetical protein